MKLHIIGIISSIIYTLIDFVKYKTSPKIVLAVLKFSSVIPFIIHYDNIFMSPFLYYALADAIIVFDFISSLPLFSIGHFLWLYWIEKTFLEDNDFSNKKNLKNDMKNLKNDFSDTKNLKNDKKIFNKHSLWLQICMIISLYTNFIIIYIVTKYNIAFISAIVFYSLFLIAMLFIGIKNKLYFISFIIISDLLIVLECAEPIVTWPLYYIFLWLTHYQIN